MTCLCTILNPDVQKTMMYKAKRLKQALNCPCRLQIHNYKCDRKWIIYNLVVKHGIIVRIISQLEQICLNFK